MLHLLRLVALFTFFIACQSTPKDNPAPVINPAAVVKNPASIGTSGDTADVTVPTSVGMVLMGGSTDVDAAIAWMIARAKGGDMVVIRASGSTGYNDYIYKDLGGVNSVETLLINTRELAFNPQVARRIRQAELLFIAGGDQGNYVKFWKDTPVAAAINYLVKDKKVPVGGTSAGCAILGEMTYSALNGTIRSEEALTNPYDARITLEKGAFIDSPFLKNTITDTHYNNPDRRGRHVVFLARALKDWKINAQGIGVEEKTAVCVDDRGVATVFGQNNAYFLQVSGNSPEACVENQPLKWIQDKKAVKVYVIAGSETGNGAFDLTNQQANKGGKASSWYVDNGTLFEN